MLCCCAPQRSAGGEAAAAQQRQWQQLHASARPQPTGCRSGLPDPLTPTARPQKHRHQGTRRRGTCSSGETKGGWQRPLLRETWQACSGRQVDGLLGHPGHPNMHKTRCKLTLSERRPWRRQNLLRRGHRRRSGGGRRGPSAAISQSPRHLHSGGSGG